MTGTYNRITDLLRSIDESVEGANAFSRAYEDGKYHEDFDADSSNVGPNLAGLYATVNSAFAIDLLRNGKFSEEGFVVVLKDMAEGKVEHTEAVIANLFANATWAAGQWFRSPERITRDAMRAFPTLPSEEQVKDVDQIVAGAKFLLSKLNDN